MKIKEVVSSGYGLVFTTGKDYNNSFNKVFESFFVCEVPSPIEIMGMLVSVYNDLECGLDMPTCVSDLYCHVYKAVGNDSYLKIDISEYITSFGGLQGNVL